MKGILLIGALIALVIVAVLTVQSVQRNASVPKVEGVELPKEMTDLPAQVKDEVNKAMEQAQERAKKAMEGVE
jgi:hypothetical protein